MKNSQNLTFLALGDSYTIGEAVEAHERWPEQLVQICLKQGIHFDPPEIIAKTGWTTDELMQAIQESVTRQTYNLVSLLIGVNNQYRGRGLADYTRDFELLLQKAISFANGNHERVVVLSIPDWGVTPFAKGRDRQAIAREIDNFNLANRQIADKYRVQYFDITPGTRKAADDLSLVAPDGLHPSGKNYAEWAEMIAQWLIPKIKNNA